MGKLILRKWILLVLIILLMGCRNKLTPGHYEGSLFWKGYSQSNSQPVGIDISYIQTESKKRTQVEIRNIDGNLVTTIYASVSSFKSIDIEIPAIRSQSFHLEKMKFEDQERNLKCYSSKKTEWTVQLCFDDMRFQLKVMGQDGSSVMSLLADAFTKEPEFILEPSIELSLDQAIQRVLGLNLDARIGFEHVLQAKHAVTAAYLNLIPHLTTNLIWNADPGYISVIATLQGLAPFVLPSYWLQAKESQIDLKIKEDAETILRADLASMVEQLAYGFDRDYEIIQTYDQTLATLNQFKNYIKDKEKNGELPSGSAHSLRSIRKRLLSDQKKIQHLLQEERYTVSQALGFHNPEAVTRIYVLPLDPSLKPKILVKSEVASLAIRRSFELHQLENLKKIAQLRRIELYFTWMDPTGDPKSGFGFNTIAQLKISKSQMRELELRKEQIEQTIYQNAYRIVDHYNSTLDYMSQLDSGSLFLDQDLYRTLKASLHEGFVLEKIDSLIKESVSEQIGFLANVSAYRIAQSKIDRMILSGYYEFVGEFRSKEILP